MNEQRAREILKSAIKPSGALLDRVAYMSWEPGDSDVVLDGQFTAEELEAIAFWMRRGSQPT